MTKRQLKQELAEHILSCQYYQDQPYTMAIIGIKYKGLWYDALGFAKVRYPDEFDPEYGKQLAMQKAISKVANQILGSPSVWIDPVQDVEELSLSHGTV